MEPFVTLSSKLIPLARSNIDTDQIIPARYLKVIDKDGLAQGLFAGWRYQPDGSPVEAFPLNASQYQNAQVLFAGENFGCGSSREHATWALRGWGIRSVISTSFGDIFRSNALKNGLLPVEITPQAHIEIWDQLQADPECVITINLPEQTLSIGNFKNYSFPIDPFSKLCLLEGIDSLEYLLKFEQQITEYERSHAV